MRIPAKIRPLPRDKVIPDTLPLGSGIDSGSAPRMRGFPEKEIVVYQRHGESRMNMSGDGSDTVGPLLIGRGYVHDRKRRIISNSLT